MTARPDVAVKIASHQFAKRNSSQNGPKADALDWAEQQTFQRDGQLGVPMIILAEEQHNARTKKSWREYRVQERASFIAAHKRNLQRNLRHTFLCELVPTGSPCLAYLDLELKFDVKGELAARDCGYKGDWPPSREQLDAARDGLLDSLVARINEMSDRKLTRAVDVMLTYSHKPSKWSCHAVIDDADTSRPSVLWRSTHDLRQFITSLHASLDDPLQRAIVDLGVYGADRLMRVCGSSKRAEPCRPLWLTDSTRQSSANLQTTVAVSGSTEDERVFRCCKRRFPIDAELLERTLITALRVDAAHLDDDALTPLGASADSTLVHVTSHYLLLVEHSVPMLISNESQLVPSLMASSSALGASAIGGRRARSAASMAPPSSELVGRICAHADFASYEPHRTFKVSSPEAFVLPCLGRTCDYAGQHSVGKQPVWLMLDMLRGRWHQMCSNSTCADKRRRRRPVPRRMSPDLLAMCEEYMRTEWPGGRVVSGLSACLGRANE